MSDRAYIGADNGVTGWWACILPSGQVHYSPVPTKKVLDYTAKKRFINRIDHVRLTEMLREWLGSHAMNAFVAMERPMINPGPRFQSSISAARSLEATLITLEGLQLPYQIYDSRKWQSVMLPSGLAEGEQKKAAVEVAKRLFPRVNTCGDADGLLIAEWARRSQL